MEYKYIMKAIYVIFSSRAEFDLAHEAAKQAAGLPRIGRVAGKLMPNNQQTTEITVCKAHPSDGTAVAEINGGWPESLKAAFTFKTREEVAEYYPEVLE